MCDVCGHNPCLRGCPNEPDEVPAAQCGLCDKDIYEGELAYEVNGMFICKACLEKEYERIL